MPPRAVGSYVSVRSVSSRYHYRRESSSSAQGGASGARPRVASPAGACVQKRVQSRAYAPPQGPLTRCPPITRHTNITVAAAHTLTRVAGAKPPRHGPSLHTAKTATKPTTVASSRLQIFSKHLARRRPAYRRPGSASHARRHARASSEGRAFEALGPESIETTSGSSKGSAAIPLAGVSGTAPGSCIVVPPPRHQKTGRVSSRQLLHSTFASTVQTSAAPHHQARSSVGSFAPPHVDGLLGPGRALSGCRREGKGPSWQHAGGAQAP